MTNDQPDGINPDGYDLPDPISAALRVGEFLEQYGDGLIDFSGITPTDFPPLYARDLQALHDAVAAFPGTLAAWDIRLQDAAAERNDLARQLADLRDDLDTAQAIRAENRELYELADSDRTVLDVKLEDAIALIGRMSLRLPQDVALELGVETRLAALKADHAPTCTCEGQLDGAPGWSHHPNCEAF